MLDAAVRAKMNILVSGGTGTGKTTLLNVLSAFIPSDERIITIEDAVELQLQQEHVVRLESRPPNIEGRGEITIRDLVRNSLRMRPDRIVVGEVRGAESLDMLQAMNTGHEGSISTLHANSPRDAIARMETLVLMAGMDLPLRAIREQIASAIDIIVQITRHKDGVRRVTHITEVHGMEGEVITLQDAFTFDYSAGLRRRGTLLGRIEPTGVRPRFAERIADHGIPLPVSLFQPDYARCSGRSDESGRPRRRNRRMPSRGAGARVLRHRAARAACRAPIVGVAPGIEHVSRSATVDAAHHRGDRFGASRSGRDRLFGAEELELAGIKSSRRGSSSSSRPRRACSRCSGSLLGLANGTSILLAIALRAARADRREGHPDRPDVTASGEVRRPDRRHRAADRGRPSRRPWPFTAPSRPSRPTRTRR